MFLHCDGARLATASTCDIILQLPTTFGKDDYDSFQEWMEVSKLINEFMESNDLFSL